MEETWLVTVESRCTFVFRSAMVFGSCDDDGVRPQHREGRPGAEWLLLDYGRLVVHIFSERARLYYDLERLWRAAPRADIPSPDDVPPHSSSRGGPFSSPSAPDSGTTQP